MVRDFQVTIPMYGMRSESAAGFGSGRHRRSGGTGRGLRSGSGCGWGVGRGDLLAVLQGLSRGNQEFVGTPEGTGDVDLVGSLLGEGFDDDVPDDAVSDDLDFASSFGMRDDDIGGDEGDRVLRNEAAVNRLSGRELPAGVVDHHDGGRQTGNDLPQGGDGVCRREQGSDLSLEGVLIGEDFDILADFCRRAIDGDFGGELRDVGQREEGLPHADELTGVGVLLDDQPGEGGTAIEGFKIVVGDVQLGFGDFDAGLGESLGFPPLPCGEFEFKFGNFQHRLRPTNDILLSGVVESNAVALDGNDLSGGDLYVEDLPVGGGIDGLQAKGLEREIDSVLVG